MPAQRVAIQCHIIFLRGRDKLLYARQIKASVGLYNGAMLHFIAHDHLFKITVGQTVKNPFVKIVVHIERHTKLKAWVCLFIQITFQGIVGVYIFLRLHFLRFFDGIFQRLIFGTGTPDGAERK
ncbi:hypothetical protein D3C80_1167750 [compost metagenome]